MHVTRIPPTVMAVWLFGIVAASGLGREPTRPGSLADPGATLDASDRFVLTDKVEKKPTAGKIPSPPRPAAEKDAPKVKVTPYGYVAADMLATTNPTNPGAFTLWVFSQDEQEGAQFIVDARRSRAGLNIEGPDLGLCGGLKSQGRLEVDFFGQFINENQASLQLRHAYWEASNDEFKFLVGQTSDVISPLLTRMLNYSVGWSGGNIGFRRAQFRFERHVPIDPWRTWVSQVSLNQDIINDFTMDPAVRREPASWPVLESRWALQVDTGDKERGKFEAGISGHYGEVGFDFLATSPPPGRLPPEQNVRLPTWSINADWSLPLSRRLSLQGEVFTGANLSSYLGGIIQGVCPCFRNEIRATGGWMDLEYRFSDRITGSTGLGIDDPKNRDFEFGRTRNQVLFGNLRYNFSKQLMTGVEVAYWQTRYQDRRRGVIPDADLRPMASGNAVVFQWLWMYTF